MGTKWGDRDARRQDILAAGRRLLTEQGYTALQMRDVAKGAQISPGTVYTYFATKEALYAALYAERLAEFAAAIEPPCTAAANPEELFVTIATEYLGMYQVYGRELNIWSVLAGQAQIDPDVGGVLLHAAGQVIEIIRCSLERLHPLAPGTDPSLVFALLWSTITGLADHFTSVRQLMHAHTWDELVHFAAHTFIAGLTAPHAENRT